MKAIIIKNGVVENISVWDANSNRPEGYEVVVVDNDFYVGIGFLYVNGVFSSPS